MREQTPTTCHAGLVFEINDNGVECLEVSGDVYSITGVKPSDLSENKVSFNSLIHDADSDVVAALFANDITANRHVYTYTFRIQSEPGAKVTILQAEVSKARSQESGGFILELSLSSAT